MANDSGHVAIVTGAASGIGLEIARRLCQRGDRVLLNDINATQLTQVVHDLVSQGYACEGYVGDIGDMSVIHDIVAHTLDVFGRIDYLVANAGITVFKKFLDVQPQDFSQIMQVNLAGTFFLCQETVRVMLEQQRGGKIVILSSNIGILAYPNLSVYSMSKAALLMMTRSLMHELAPLQININALAPGATLTERTASQEPGYADKWAPVTIATCPESFAMSWCWLRL